MPSRRYLRSRACSTVCHCFVVRFAFGAQVVTLVADNCFLADRDAATHTLLGSCDHHCCSELTLI